MSHELDAPPLYKFILGIVDKPLKWFHRMEFNGLETLPPKGKGFIATPLHNGIFDAAFVSVALAESGRGVRWVTDDEIHSTPLIGDFLRGIGTIPVAVHKGKSKDSAQVRQAMAEAGEALRQGEVIGLFPEGEIRPIYEPREPYPFRPGVLRLALASGAPIIPIWAEGADRVLPWLYSTVINGAEFFLVAPLWLPFQVKVHIGQPFKLSKGLSLESPRQDLVDEAERLRGEMLRLMGK